MSITYDKEKLREKANSYCKKNNTLVAQEIGFGTQGVVFRTAHNTALKVYDLQQGYERERDVYTRLQDKKIESVRGLSIPRIINWDDELLTFEMTIVSVPCLIDFGGAYLDNAPDHMQRDEYWLEQKKDEFGDRWQEAQAVIKEIEFRGNIWLADVNTGNIKFC